MIRRPKKYDIIKISKMSIGGGKMANHIKYIDIHKFKGIKDINIYDMKSINIFVGDNNSEKQQY